MTMALQERARLGSLGAAGVALTHCLAYYLSLEEVPHRGAMHHVQDGHGLWPAAIIAALLLSIATLASRFVSPPSESIRTRGVFVRLATIQCTVGSFSWSRSESSPSTASRHCPESRSCG